MINTHRAGAVMSLPRWHMINRLCGVPGKGSKMTDKITSQDVAMANLIEATANNPARDTVESLRAKLDAATAEQDAYKRKVAKVMTTYATQHNLCSVADQALAEVGLRRIQESETTCTATITVTWIQGAAKRRDPWSATGAVLRAARELLDFDGNVSEANSYLSDGTFDGRSGITITDFTFEFNEGEADPNGHLLPIQDSSPADF